MQKELLLEMLAQNKMTTLGVLNRVTAENAHFRLNAQTSSAGFIYRHTAETMNRLGNFLGVPTDVENTTMGMTDEGQGKDIEASRALIQKGYAAVQAYIEKAPADAWLEPVETPFFGTVSRMRILSHILFHNSYHSGQIGLTLKRGK